MTTARIRRTEPMIDGPAASRFEISRSRLSGEVTVSGAKNSVLRLLAASLLTGEPVVLSNYPATLLDAVVHVGMIEGLGKRCTLDHGTITIEQPGLLASALDWPGRSIRNTLLILGALVARTGQGSVPLPGGCAVGDRRFDLHELVLTRLGARVWQADGQLHAEAPRGLTGADIVLPLRSTGATENALLAASLARGTTTLWNPHLRPEILDLVAVLREMGAAITVNGQESIVVVGADALRGVRHRVMPDNMEALMWLIGAVITGGDVEISDFPAHHLEVPLIFLQASGARVFRDGDRTIVRGGRPFPVEISTGPYPGINSDMQPLFAALGACARGTSRITDLRFPDRYAYLSEFARLGVDCETRAGVAHIRGGTALTGAQVHATDLRAGVALALLGMTANGVTTLHDAWQVERGCDRFVEKAQALGAQVEAA